MRHTEEVLELLGDAVGIMLLIIGAGFLLSLIATVILAGVLVLTGHWVPK